MENMARLADLESKLAKSNLFNELVIELHRLLNGIISNPSNEGARTVADGVLCKLHDCKEFWEYMEYIGFEKVSNQFVFPKEKSLSKLKVAHAALDKKINYIKKCDRPVPIEQTSKQENVQSFELIDPEDPFLERIANLFHEMQKYEDESLQEEARTHIPIEQLKQAAIERIKEHEERQKAGDSQATPLSLEIAMLHQLVGWFKHEFFSWVNEPECETCHCPTSLVQKVQQFVETETCIVEVYRCPKCRAAVSFPRRNDPRALLATRRGRCGEWANCFTLLARALGYDTRYVYDVTDHVWCEVYDACGARWLHVDACEARVDAPLLYCAGWGKRLSYVLAFSRDDLQDVTWRYTTDHQEVLRRRTAVSEPRLLRTLLRLRAAAHRRLPQSRRDELARRTVAELAEMMAERKASDYETQGRISGSLAWRTARGEARGEAGGHQFVLAAGAARVAYSAAADAYACGLRGWAAGAWASRGVARKVENDWRQAYLARSEGEETGWVSWRLTAASGVKFVRVAVQATCALYEDGDVTWTAQFDDGPPEPLAVTGTEMERECRAVVIRAQLSGGRGAVAWQHAQLFRQPLDDRSDTFVVRAHLVAE